MNLPTTRSRTSLFLSFRESRAPASRYSHASGADDADDVDDDEQQGLIPQSRRHHAIDLDLPPKWAEVSQQVEGILRNTQAKIAALERLHAKHVLPGFSDRSQEEREIEAATTEITKDFRNCQGLIQKIGTVANHSFPPSQSDARQRQNEIQAAKNVQRGLAAKVQDMSAAFRKKQRVYMEKLQGHAIKNQDLLIAAGTISLKGSEGMSAVDDDMAAARHTRTQSQSHSQALLVEDSDLDTIRSRDRELTEIAKSISTLAELFKDLSNLVIDQGTLLDSVEYNIEQTAVHIQGAVEELNTATRYQKNTGRRKCIFLLVLIIFGLIMVIIFKPRRQRVNPPPPSSDPSFSLLFSRDI